MEGGIACCGLGVAFVDFLDGELVFLWTELLKVLVFSLDFFMDDLTEGEVSALFSMVFADFCSYEVDDNPFNFLDSDKSAVLVLLLTVPCVLESGELWVTSSDIG
ncbi:unnamed protein product [Cylicostephanus goldi]|uniref:Uncharacterized protein n=1 Tax=Cylicostephanus goldi TaxID=71465 RepID=A0A3P6RG53_CYLGO|nr:unnamed protein product [Cylicostephanus goldi]